MSANFCGSVNDLTDMTIDLEGEKNMENKILDLMNEVEFYEQAVQDAKDALASAELELDLALSKEFDQQ